MNFTISEINWDIFGTQTEGTSEWTGVVGIVHRKEADLGVSEFVFSDERARAVRFTSPIATGPFQLHVRKLDAEDVQWNAHFRVMNESSQLI